MQLKNRMIMAPMATHYADEEGAVTERLNNYHAASPRGGVGLIIIESGYIHPLGRGGRNRLGLHDDGLIPGLKGLVNLIHSEGARICSQLHHAGRQVNVQATNGKYPVSASSIPAGMEGIVPRTLKIGEIEELIAAFGQAARRSLEAGFDAILLHAGHGYLIHQFLSPLSNIRQDPYGGNFQRRLRFLKEVIHHCREITGKDFPLMVRISASEFIPGGITLRDGQKIARQLEQWGVDAIHVSGGTHDTQEMELQPMAIPRGCLVPLAEGIKKVVRIPVAAVGRIADPQMAEEILQAGKADLITLGRALLADPDFPRKTQEGRWADIRPCIACLQGCRGHLYQGKPITCLVNPQAGMEREYGVERALRRRKVFIIGGGPGGMEAARVAALRGHDVTLVEKNDRLGGQFHLASLPPGKEEIRFFLEYLAGQLQKLRVKVILNREFTPADFPQAEADVYILANGAVPKRPAIPGVDFKNVLTAWDALLAPERAGEKVLVVGAGAVGAETADFLAERGRKVSLIEMTQNIAADEEQINRKLLLRRLGEKGVKIRVKTQAKAVFPEGLEVEGNGQKEVLRADTIVMATGVQETREFEDVLRSRQVEFYRIGDCQSPRKAIDAIHEGFQAALRI
jgi:2,4-dienoyl-CoA reductase-like NADH-dependent reductase (Old Yellow Enzyme family)/thioredoxin reductase